jgi:hypothetical protein
MKYITLQQLERDFDRIFDDVVDNSEHYTITGTSVEEDGEYKDTSVVMMPYDEFNVLKETYEEWIDTK